MLNISFRACTKIELWDLTICAVVNGEKFLNHAMAFYLGLTISKLSELFSYTTMYLNFTFLDQLLFELSCKKNHMETHKKH